jgi:hypothetical protein
MPSNTKWARLSPYVRSIFVPCLEFYRQIVMEKFLPSLNDEAIAQKAEKKEREAFERMGWSVSLEDYDQDSFVDDASEEGFEFYRLMHNTRQGLINGLAAAFYHLFEQQICQFYRLITWNKKAVLSGKEARKET